MEDSRLDYLLLVAQVLLLPSSRWQRLRGPASAVITLITATLSPLSLSLHTSTLICIHHRDNNISQTHTMVFARNDMIGLLLCAIILMYWRNSEVFVAMFKGYQQKLYTFQIKYNFIFGIPNIIHHQYLCWKVKCWYNLKLIGISVFLEHIKG